MKAQKALDILTVLDTKVSNLKASLTGVATQIDIEDSSSQTWYGVPEAIIDDINQATELIVLATNKVNTITNPTTLA